MVFHVLLWRICYLLYLYKENSFSKILSFLHNFSTNFDIFAKFFCLRPLKTSFIQYIWFNMYKGNKNINLPGSVKKWILRNFSKSENFRKKRQKCVKFFYTFLSFCLSFFLAVFGVHSQFLPLTTVFIVNDSLSLQFKLTYSMKGLIISDVNKVLFFVLSLFQEVSHLYAVMLCSF